MAASAGGQRLLELKGVSKRFGALDALTGVDFEVDAGEVVALVGDNGAGKSTLVKAIAGVQLADEGEFFIKGQKVAIASPNDATLLGITTVYQDLALCDNLDIVANLYLGRERFVGGPSRLTGSIDENEMEKSSVQLLDSLSVTTVKSVRSRVASLSGGQRQAVAIARSLLGDPSVVLLDEPTAALGVAQTRQVLDLIRRLRERGLGIVVISHNLADVFDVADRIIVLRLGKRVSTFDVRDASQEDVVGAITGAEFGEVDESGSGTP
jgi:D-xylose transport system ATP-binding protein